MIRPFCYVKRIKVLYFTEAVSMLPSFYFVYIARKSQRQRFHGAHPAVIFDL